MCRYACTCAPTGHLYDARAYIFNVSHQDSNARPSARRRRDAAWWNCRFSSAPNYIVCQWETTSVSYIEPRTKRVKSTNTERNKKKKKNQWYITAECRTYLCLYLYLDNFWMTSIRACIHCCGDPGHSCFSFDVYRFSVMLSIILRTHLYRENNNFAIIRKIASSIGACPIIYLCIYRRCVYWNRTRAAENGSRRYTYHIIYSYTRTIDSN